MNWPRWLRRALTRSIPAHCGVLNICTEIDLTDALVCPKCGAGIVNSSSESIWLDRRLYAGEPMSNQYPTPLVLRLQQRSLPQPQWHYRSHRFVQSGSQFRHRPQLPRQLLPLSQST